MKLLNQILNIILLVNALSCFQEKKEFKKVEAINFPAIAFINASELRCRKEPNVNSPIIKTILFATPIIIDRVSENEETLDNLKDRWMYSKNNKCWAFGGYLLISKLEFSKIAKLNVSTHMPCQSAELTGIYPLFLIGDIYFKFDKYFLGPSPPMMDGVILEIGYFSKNNNLLIFKPERKVALNLNGTFFGYFNKSNLKNWELLEMNDEEGIYYIYPGLNKNISRKEARNNCLKDATRTEGRDYPLVIAFIKKEITFEKMNEDIKIFIRENIIASGEMENLLSKCKEINKEFNSKNDKFDCYVNLDKN